MSVIIVVISAKRNKVQWRGVVTGKTLHEPRHVQSRASASKPQISALPDRLDGLLLADRSHSRHRTSIGARTLDIVGTQWTTILVIIVHVAATLVVWWYTIHGWVLAGVSLSVVAISTVRRASTGVIADNVVKIASR
jgi:hypothetical protein